MYHFLDASLRLGENRALHIPSSSAGFEGGEEPPMDTRLPRGHYYGRILRRYEVGGLLLNETCYAPGERIPPHAHQQAYFCLVRRGGYTETYRRRTRVCKPLPFVFHPPEETHAQQFHQAEVRSFNIEVTASCLARLQEYAPVLRNPLDCQDGALAGLALRLYREFQELDAVSPLA